MNSSAVKVGGNKRNLICIALNGISSGIFNNSQKDHEDEVFLYENISHFISKCPFKHHKYVNPKWLHVHFKTTQYLANERSYCCSVYDAVP